MRRKPKRPGALYARLPAGAHGIEREKVERNQRSRIQGAMVAAVARHGFAKTTISEVVDLASVSRTTFYQHFKSKEDCFLAAHDTIVEFGSERVSDAYRSDGDWRERLHAAFVAFMDVVTSQPDAAKLAIVETLAAGPRALEHRERASRTFEELIRQSLDQAPERAEVSDITIRAMVGGIRRVVYTHLRHDQPERLPALVDDLFEWAMDYRALGVEPPADPQPPASNGANQPAAAPPNPRQVHRDRMTLTHRERIQQAVSSIVYDKGYGALTIPEISATAGISNQTFYENFRGKEQALLATFDDSAQRALTETAVAVGGGATWEEGIRAGLDAVLGFLAAQPTFARLAFLHLLTAGRPAQERSELLLDGFTALLTPGFERRPDTPRVVGDAITGGIWSVIHDEIAKDRIATLPSLAPSATYIALAPFIGAGAAADIARG